MNQRKSVIVKHDRINQIVTNDNMHQFYESASDESADEDLISHELNDEEVAVVVEPQNDEEEARKQTNKLKRKKRKETKQDRDDEFEFKQALYEAAKQDFLSKKFKSQRACASYYGLCHASLNNYIRNDSGHKRTGSALKVRYIFILNTYEKVSQPLY